jgi:hypothetical protein
MQSVRCALLNTDNAAALSGESSQKVTTKDLFGCVPIFRDIVWRVIGIFMANVDVDATGPGTSLGTDADEAPRTCVD